MTSRARIVPYNDHDDAVLTPSAAAVTGFEIENTQNMIRTHAWKTTSAASQSFTGVWSASRTVSHFSMPRHLNQAGSVRLQLFTDAAATTPASPFSDSGVVSATPYSSAGGYTWSTGTTDPFLTESPYWLWFAETVARSYKVTFSGTPAQSYWYTSRIWMGRYKEFATNPSVGLEISRQDITDRNRSRGGSLRTNVGQSWRTLQFEFGGINEAEFPFHMDLMDRAGTGRDVLISIFPGDGTRLESLHTMAGRLSALNAIGRQVGRLTGRYQIEEN